MTGSFQDTARRVIGIEAQALTLPDGSTVGFPVDAFAKRCLLAGVDQLGYSQSLDEQIVAYEQKQVSF